MARKPKTQQTILEEARGNLSKVEFCGQVGISRPTYDKYLEGRYISLEWLSYLAVDYVDDWRGQMARELIQILHGPEHLPMGSFASISDNRQAYKISGGNTTEIVFNDVQQEAV